MRRDRCMITWLYMWYCPGLEPRTTFYLTFHSFSCISSSNSFIIRCGSKEQRGDVVSWSQQSLDPSPKTIESFHCQPLWTQHLLLVIRWEWLLQVLLVKAEVRKMELCGDLEYLEILSNDTDGLFLCLRAAVGIRSKMCLRSLYSTAGIYAARAL